MVMHLSDMLRMTLVDSDQQETTLERELRFLRLYLKIEQTRFRDRLQVGWDIAPGLEQAAVPTQVEIAAHRHDEMLTLRVTDNGLGLSGNGGTPGAGIGLPSTRARLAALYGSRHGFALKERESGGVTVTVSIPWRLMETNGG